MAVTVDQLSAQLDEIDKISNDEWLKMLEGRKIRELEFHDRKQEHERSQTLDVDTFEKFHGNKKYYSTTRMSHEYVDNWIRSNAAGKVFLDYACGKGGNAIKAAQAGAALAIGLDISPASVKNARSDAEVAGVSANTRFIQADAENTKLANESVDVVICSGMLHHLDLSYAFPELRRILKPGGKILAVEALDYNPAIKLYRMLTPQMRTEWEKAHILSLADVRFASRFFDVGEIRFWHVTSYLGAHLRRFLPLLEGIDAVLTRIPGVRLMAWIFTFELLKPGRRN
ncbi:MAG: class I SAM-dependent methyltransferase [Thermoanaerobaculia bacterium]